MITTGSCVFLIMSVGEVYDVATGKQFYAPNGGYAGTAGRDGSRGFSTGMFGNLSEDLTFFAANESTEILGWRNFYRNHATYRFVGVLEGPYFDAKGYQIPGLEDLEIRYEKEMRLKIVFTLIFFTLL